MPTLSSLLPGFEDTDIHVSGICDDSRKAQRGDLFIAVSGEQYSAHQMLVDVKDSNLAAALYDPQENIDKTAFEQLTTIPVKNLMKRRGEIAGSYYGNPSSDMLVVAVTGTNGKTSCSQYIASAFETKCGVIGTMGWGVEGELRESGLTTPDVLRLHQLLSMLKAQGASAVSLEASSHGLVQGRLDNVQVDIAVLTNLTRDHLDYHGSEQAYKQAKATLFKMPDLKTAVLNADDDFSVELEECIESKVDVLRYSLQNPQADVFFETVAFDSTGIKGVVTSPWGDINIVSPLIGSFNAENLLAVICVLGASGYNSATISRRIAQLHNIKGRMDRIPLPSGGLAVIDYAHTPDALENALQALRLHTTGQLICVMGCGGDRDNGKRPLMGEISSRIADFTIVTDDNPRTEDSSVIIEQIIAGVAEGSKVEVVSNREEAIKRSLSLIGREDLVLIAGKGHEEYQEIGGVRTPFSDYMVVEAFVGQTNAATVDGSLINDSEREHENRGA